MMTSAHDEKALG